MYADFLQPSTKRVMQTADSVGAAVTVVQYGQQLSYLLKVRQRTHITNSIVIFMSPVENIISLFREVSKKCLIRDNFYEARLGLSWHPFSIKAFIFLLIYKMKKKIRVIFILCIHLLYKLFFVDKKQTLLYRKTIAPFMVELP